MLEVSDTMLITLYARARESRSRNPVINDPKGTIRLMPLNIFLNYIFEE